MRSPSCSFFGSLLAAALLAGCAANSQSQNPVIPNLGAAGQGNSELRGGHASPALYKGLRALYVGDSVTGAVDVLSSGNYRDIGAISNGVNVPEGLALDTNGNLYVANANAGSVTEYAPSATSPFFTYSAQMLGPKSVVVDAHGNLFELDGGGSSGNYINEYFQGVDYPAVRGPLPAGITPEGVAVDRAGDVFVSYNDVHGLGTIAVFLGGLTTSAPPTVLAGLSGPVGGIALDKQANLIVCDDFDQEVIVLPPPYNGYNRVIGTGFIRPSQVTLNRANTKVFVTDSHNRNVTVVNYTTGANITTLGAKNGIGLPLGIAIGPEAI